MAGAFCKIVVSFSGDAPHDAAPLTIHWGGSISMSLVIPVYTAVRDVAGPLGIDTSGRKSSVSSALADMYLAACTQSCGTAWRTPSKTAIVDEARWPMQVMQRQSVRRSCLLESGTVHADAGATSVVRCT